MSIAHNKNPIPLLNFLNKYISAKSTVQTLSIKYECTFRFSNFVKNFVVIQLICHFT